MRGPCPLERDTRRWLPGTAEMFGGPPVTEPHQHFLPLVGTKEPRLSVPPCGNAGLEAARGSWLLPCPGATGLSGQALPLLGKLPALTGCSPSSARPPVLGPQAHPPPLTVPRTQAPLAETPQASTEHPLWARALPRDHAECGGQVNTHDTCRQETQSMGTWGHFL